MPPGCSCRTHTSYPLFVLLRSLASRSKAEEVARKADQAQTSTAYFDQHQRRHARAFRGLQPVAHRLPVRDDSQSARASADKSLPIVSLSWCKSSQVSDDIGRGEVWRTDTTGVALKLISRELRWGLSTAYRIVAYPSPESKRIRKSFRNLLAFCSVVADTNAVATAGHSWERRICFVHRSLFFICPLLLPNKRAWGK